MLHNTSDDQLKRKMNWFCENYISFKWNYWMTLHATGVKLNWIEFQVN
jgi:hypothetical protein